MEELKMEEYIMEKEYMPIKDLINFEDLLREEKSLRSDPTVLKRGTPLFPNITITSPSYLTNAELKAREKSCP